MALQDPAGAVPEPDAAGRIVLTETKTVAAGAAIGLLVACGMAVLSVWFFASLWAGTLAPGWYLRLRVIAWIGLIFLPAIPWMLLNLLYLRRLVIDDGGITDRMGGRVRHMAWGEIRRIDVREVAIDRSGGRQTMTDVQSAAGRTIAWLPVFGVAPVALAEYLSARRSQVCGGALGVTDRTTTPARRRRYRLVAAGSLALLAIVAVAIRYVAIRH